jgi:hypothetical protein
MPSYTKMAYMSAQGPDGLLFAKSAIDFACLARVAEGKCKRATSVHLYTTAIEIAFKSLALRSGATLAECEKVGHNISKLFALLQRHGIAIPPTLDRKLNDSASFKSRLLGTRYTVFNPEEDITYHRDYFAMIAVILEIPCPKPLHFKGGTALAELEALVAYLKSP